MKNQTLLQASFLATLVATGNAFVATPTASKMSQHLTFNSRLFSSVVEANDSTDMQDFEAATKPENAAPRKVLPKVRSPTHKEGLFSPAVYAAKMLLGDKRLNTVRAKAISMHSEVIASFVQTANSDVGNSVLTNIFLLLDANRDGTLCEKELAAGFQKLGFTWLEEKQIRGILARADKDANGVLDFQEFEAEAPKTLKTNLIKLAKKNGGDLGLLV
jgi:hypothetical protein